METKHRVIKNFFTIQDIWLLQKQTGLLWIKGWKTVSQTKDPLVRDQWINQYQTNMRNFEEYEFGGLPIYFQNGNDFYKVENNHQVVYLSLKDGFSRTLKKNYRDLLQGVAGVPIEKSEFNKALALLVRKN